MEANLRKCLVRLGQSFLGKFISRRFNIELQDSRSFLSLSLRCYVIFLVCLCEIKQLFFNRKGYFTKIRKRATKIHEILCRNLCAAQRVFLVCLCEINLLPFNLVTYKSFKSCKHIVYRKHFKIWVRH